MERPLDSSAGTRPADFRAECKRHSKYQRWPPGQMVSLGTPGLEVWYLYPCLPQGCERPLPGRPGAGRRHTCSLRGPSPATMKSTWGYCWQISGMTCTMRSTPFRYTSLGVGATAPALRNHPSGWAPWGRIRRTRPPSVKLLH